MTRNSMPRMALTIGFVALAACGETPTETQSTRPLSSLPPDFAVASNTWITRANMALSRAAPAAAAVTNAAGESKLYAIGGLSATGRATKTVQEYDVATNTWTLRAPMPVTVYATNGVGVIGRKLYISGGIRPPATGRRQLYMYDPDTDTWTQKRSMPAPGSHGVTGVINGRLYVLTDCSAGAECDPFVPLAFYRYDPISDRWAVLPAPTSGHHAGEGGVIGGKFYVTGGDDVTQLDVYDPATNAWTTKAPMPQDQSFGAGAILGAKLYVIGGVERLPDGTMRLVSKTSVYDPATDSWSAKAPIPEDRANLAGTRVFLNGQPRIEVVGGQRPGNNIQYVP